MTMDKVYPRSPGLTTLSSSVCGPPNRSINGSTHPNGNGVSPSLNSNHPTNVPLSSSRLPQRRDPSKIPGPQSSSPSVCLLSGISSSSSPSTVPSISSPATSNTIAPPKKFLNPPGKLICAQGTVTPGNPNHLIINGNDSSLRSVSPATVFKCKPTQASHLINQPSSAAIGRSTMSPSTTTATTDGSTATPCTSNGNSESSLHCRGIKPPRSNGTQLISNLGLLNNVPSGPVSVTNKSLLTVSRSHITKHSVINNGLASVGRSGSAIQRSANRPGSSREVKEDGMTCGSNSGSEVSRRVRTASTVRSTASSNNRPNFMGSLVSGLNTNVRSDSSPSLTEASESGSERRPVNGNHNSNKSLPVRSNLTKGLGPGGGSGHGIPMPKSRPTSVCLETPSASVLSSPSTSSVTSVTSTPTSMSVKSPSNVSAKSVQNKSSLRPLSSSGIPKQGLSGSLNRTPTAVTSSALKQFTEESPITQPRNDPTEKRVRRVNATGESLLTPTRSEPNVARVSPIRRSMGQMTNNGNGSTNHHEARPVVEIKESDLNQPGKPQYDLVDKVNEDPHTSTLSGPNISPRVTSSLMMPKGSICPPSSSSPSSGSASLITSSTSSKTSTVTSSSLNPQLTHPSPLGLSPVNRSSEPMLPILSSSSNVISSSSSATPTPTATTTTSTLRSVNEESLPTKARSTLSLSTPSSPLHRSTGTKDPRIKTIDPSGHISSFNLTSNRSGSCDLICSLSSCTDRVLSCSSNTKSIIDSSQFTSESFNPSPANTHTTTAPITTQNHCFNPQRQSIDSPFDSSFNQTVIDGNSSMLLTDQESSKSDLTPGRSESVIHASLTSTTNLTRVPSTSNLVNLQSKLNRRSKCTLPSEAELTLTKTDLRLTSYPTNNGFNCCGSSSINSYEGSSSNRILMMGPASTPQPTSSPQLIPQPTVTSPPPPMVSAPSPFILQSVTGLTNQVKRLSKTGELRGSTISLLSGSSSFSATEERQNQEIKKLRDELNRAHSKVETLTHQLKNSNDMIQTFGKSLETLRSRLYSCSLATDQKDREIARLKTTIEVLRREVASNLIADGDASSLSSNGSPGTLSSNSATTGMSGSKAHFGSASEIETSSRRDKSKKRSHKEPRSPSRDRDAIHSTDSSTGPSGWFKGSIQRAFKKTRSRNKSGGSISDVEGSSSSSATTTTINTKLNCIALDSTSTSLPSTPLAAFGSLSGKADPFVGLTSLQSNGTRPVHGGEPGTSSSLNLSGKEESDLIDSLRKQLRDKEKQLNDIRLEVLLSASQTESLNDRIGKMNKETSLLRSENHRLQCLLRRQSITSSIGSLTSCFEATGPGVTTSSTNSLCNGNHPPSGSSSSSSSPSSTTQQQCHSHLVSNNVTNGTERLIPIKLGHKKIGLLQFNPQLNWESLDEIVKRTFESFLRKIDAERLELRTNSLISYSFGSERFERKLTSPSSCLSSLSSLKSSSNEIHTSIPNMSNGSSPFSSSSVTPIDFLLRNEYINLYLRSKLEYLVMDTCTPKSVLEKITSHLRESRRLVICGPPNCGKSFIALKCCQFLLEEHCMDCATGVASISVHEEGDKEIECFLSNVLNCDEIGRPKAILFKGIHNLINFTALLKPIRGIHYNDLPLLLCTMRGVNSDTTNLQIYHNFRSLIFNQSNEPCKNLISRVLRRKALEHEIDSFSRGSNYHFNSISSLFDWLQQLYYHLNLFLEAFSSPLKPHNLGPSVFFSCPVEAESCQEWFTNIWNHSIVPKVKQIVGDFDCSSIDLTQDPLIWIRDNYPWTGNKEWINQLSPIIETNRTIGCKPKVDSITDQLHNTLLRLQEATKG